ncbi:MAG: hypothetical protein RIC56_11740 [Pseudomonadales bacterium]
MQRLLWIAMLLASPLALADSHTADTGPVMETFRCDFHEGKGPDDIWASAEFFNQQVDKMNSEALNSYFAAVLLPFRASMEGDYGWIGEWPSLRTMARGLQDYYASPLSAAVEKRFAEVADCRANTWFVEDLVDNYPDDDATPLQDAVEIYSCTLRDGVTMAQVSSAEQAFVKANGEAPVAVQRWTPFLANTPADLAYLVAHEDIGSFADFNAAWLASEAGRANQAAFAEVMDCESGLYTGRVLREPASTM